MSETLHFHVFLPVSDSPTETYHPSSIKPSPRNYCCCQQDSNNIMQRATSRSVLRPFVRPSSQSAGRTASHEDKQSSKLFDQSTAEKNTHRPIDRENRQKRLRISDSHSVVDERENSRTHDADRAAHSICEAAK